MNENAQDDFERELSRLKPARLPEELMTRLTSAPAELEISGEKISPVRRNPGWWPLLRRLIPTTAAAAISVLVWRSFRMTHELQLKADVAARQPALKANEVEIDHQLVASFDAVALMPDGEPVRFRCREWSDDVVMRDRDRGVVIEQSTPRVEIVPVRLEVY